MNPLHVYLAMPFAERASARAINRRLEALGLMPTGTWCVQEQPEDALTLGELRYLATCNDADVERSHALLVIASAGQGGEMFCEVGRALVARTPIAWVGRRVLSTRRPGVVEAPSVEAAVTLLQGWAQLIARPYPMPAEWGRAAIWNTVLEADAELRVKARKTEAA
jgi:hypothetical protein